jgi:hypothetical protein
MKVSGKRRSVSNRVDNNGVNDGHRKRDVGPGKDEQDTWDLAESVGPSTFGDAIRWMINGASQESLVQLIGALNLPHSPWKSSSSHDDICRWIKENQNVLMKRQQTFLSSVKATFERQQTDYLRVLKAKKALVDEKRRSKERYSEFMARDCKLMLGNNLGTFGNDAMCLQNSPVVRLQNSPVVRLQNSPVVRLRNSPVVRLQNSSVVRLQNSSVVRLQNSSVVRLQNSSVVGFRSSEDLMETEAERWGNFLFAIVYPALSYSNLGDQIYLANFDQADKGQGISILATCKPIMCRVRISTPPRGDEGEIRGNKGFHAPRTPAVATLITDVPLSHLASPAPGHTEHSLSVYNSNAENVHTVTIPANLDCRLLAPAWFRHVSPDQEFWTSYIYQSTNYDQNAPIFKTSSSICERKSTHVAKLRILTRETERYRKLGQMHNQFRHVTSVPELWHLVLEYQLFL